MRLKTGIWVRGLVRRVFSAGGFAAIERHGAEEGGAVLVRTRDRGGLESVFTPAPQSFFETEQPEERRFEQRLAEAGREECDRLIARETNFDPDAWVIELEVDDPASYLVITPA
ncbi:DUF1491 family protein [Pararhizobium mangrovi]|uniref:DUF1491 family protein n=1 Tax=Pararhizobium mangrovi TaxID=2590452 RepID=A0A506UHE2_9HYPH|nr:DUF1491 family protein [Pararhizobium mangrovi]TPW32730.1 DUF1491 family protein [Pararhizobium mangrovi]